MYQESDWTAPTLAAQELEIGLSENSVDEQNPAPVGNYW
jgi:hypothetical protein